MDRSNIIKTTEDTGTTRKSTRIPKVIDNMKEKEEAKKAKEERQEKELEEVRQKRKEASAKGQATKRKNSK